MSDSPRGIPVARLNHAVLYVRDLDRSVDFYRRVFGFEEISRIGGSTGLYHLAWEVPRIEDLARAAEVLRAEGALGGASDHGATKSLYGQDPDGNEFEVMWMVPRHDWRKYESEATVAPLDLEAELGRYGGAA
jgi:catechol-2,3-dioxygenase